MAAGLTALLSGQALLILAGVTGLFPLSGIALPFFSYGNSAMVAAYAAIGLLRGISATASAQPQAYEARPEGVAAGRVFGFTYTLVMLGVIGVWRLADIQVVHANAYASRTIRTPDADHVVRPHINPRLLAMADGIERGSIYRSEWRGARNL